MSAQFEEALSLLHEANTAFVKLVWMGHLKRPEHRDLAARIARFTAGYTEPESSEDA